MFCMFSWSKNHKGILGAFWPFWRSGITKSLMTNDFQFILVPFGKSWFWRCNQSQYRQWLLLLRTFVVCISINNNSHCRYCDWLQRQNQVLPNGTKINWKSLVISDFVIPDLQNGQNAPKMPPKCLYDFCFMKTCKT